MGLNRILVDIYSNGTYVWETLRSLWKEAHLPIWCCGVLDWFSLIGSITIDESIDYVGAALLVIGTVPLLLGFTWAGSQYDWLSPQIIGLFGVAIVALASFIIYEAWLERRGGQPIIEPSLFKNRIFSVSTLITTICGMALFGGIFFIPLYVQGVVGSSSFFENLNCYIPFERNLKTLIAT